MCWLSAVIEKKARHKQCCFSSARRKERRTKKKTLEMKRQGAPKPSVGVFSMQRTPPPYPKKKNLSSTRERCSRPRS